MRPRNPGTLTRSHVPDTDGATQVWRTHGRTHASCPGGWDASGGTARLGMQSGNGAHQALKPASKPRLHQQTSLQASRKMTACPASSPTCWHSAATCAHSPQLMAPPSTHMQTARAVVLCTPGPCWMGHPTHTRASLLACLVAGSAALLATGQATNTCGIYNWCFPNCSAVTRLTPARPGRQKAWPPPTPPICPSSMRSPCACGFARREEGVGGDLGSEGCSRARHEVISCMSCACPVHVL